MTVGRPDPGSREPEEGNQDISPVLLDEGDDGEVGGGVQEEGDKVFRLPEEGVLDGGNKEGVGGKEVQSVG